MVAILSRPQYVKNTSIIGVSTDFYIPYTDGLVPFDLSFRVTSKGANKTTLDDIGQYSETCL